MKIESIALPGYPPDTAPKDKIILGDFGYATFLPCVWNPAKEKWMSAVMRIGAIKETEDDVSFGNKHMLPTELLGWQPMITCRSYCIGDMG